MKRIVAIIAIAAILTLMMSTFVFADDSANTPQWFRDMMSWRKAQVDQAEKDGSLTKDQAKLYRDHIDQMEKFHAENGFPNHMRLGGFGGCGGSFNSSNPDNENTSYGFGRGMMNGYRVR